MKIKKYIAIFLILLISSFILVGCDKKDETKDLKEKSNSQIAYLENTLSRITNGILLKEYTNSEENAKNGNKNNDSKKQSESESTKNTDNSSNVNEENNTNNQAVQIDWDKLNQDLEDIYSSWSILAIDLNKLNVDNKEILSFGQIINDVKISIQSKNESNLLISLINLYSYIPKYISSYSDDSFEVAKKNIKYCIINTGILVKNDNWDEAIKQIEIAENEYIKLMNNANYASQNSYNMNKIYILLEEVKNAIGYRNQDIFFMKYQALTDEI